MKKITTLSCTGKIMFARIMFARLMAALLLLIASGSFSVSHASDNALTEEQRGDLKKISRYLHVTKKFKTRIIQHNPDGTQLGGMLYVNRPGRLRLEYDAPETLLLFAANKHFTLLDRSNYQTVHYPFFTTPASLLLSDDITLENSDMRILDLHRYQGLIYLTLASKDEDDKSKLILIFAQKPFMLRGWQVLDTSQNLISVVFEKLESNITYPQRGFFDFNNSIPNTVTPQNPAN